MLKCTYKGDFSVCWFDAHSKCVLVSRWRCCHTFKQTFYRVYLVYPHSRWHLKSQILVYWFPVSVWGFCHITRTLEVFLSPCWWKRLQCLGTNATPRYFLTHSPYPPALLFLFAFFTFLVLTKQRAFFIPRWGRMFLPSQQPRQKPLRWPQLPQMLPTFLRPLCRGRGQSRRGKETARNKRSHPMGLPWLRRPPLYRREYVGESNWATGIYLPNRVIS